MANIPQITAHDLPTRDESVQGRTEYDPNYNSPAIGGAVRVAGLALQSENVPPPYNYAFPFYRDRWLRDFYKSEPILTGAVYGMVAKMQALAWQLEGPPRAKTYAQNVLTDCESGGGLRRLAGRLITDYLTQDNGAFVELVGKGNPLKPLRGPLVAPYLMHLDSQRCWRTHDPEYPVVYSNPRTGAQHALHYTRVVSVSNFEQPDELARGVGYCAVSRVLEYARYMTYIQTYKREKAGGNFTRGFLITNANAAEFEAASQRLQANEHAHGLAYFRQLPVISNPVVSPEAKLIDLAAVGDGFDFETEMTLYVYAIAMAMGVDAREFWPATASGATKADATIQHLKAQGKGLADLITTLEYLVRMALPPSVEFKYDFTDDEADKQRADIQNQQAALYTGIMSAGGMNPQQYQAHLIAKGILDAKIMAMPSAPISDITPITQETAFDAEQPLEVAVQGDVLPRPADDDTNEPIPLPDTKGATPTEWGRGYKALDDTQAAYERQMRALFNDLANQDIEAQEAETAIREATRAAMLQAARDALLELGVDFDRMPRALRDQIEAALTDDENYIKDVVRMYYSETPPTPEQTNEKPRLWFNMSVYPAFLAGLAYRGGSGETGQRARWRLGRTEKHCRTCLSLDGQVQPVAEYIKAGLVPRSPNLECKGFNCDCRLELTNDAISGSLVGLKMHGADCECADCNRKAVDAYHQEWGAKWQRRLDRWAASSWT
jgi:hypothetical protein